MPRLHNGVLHSAYIPYDTPVPLDLVSFRSASLSRPRTWRMCGERSRS